MPLVLDGAVAGWLRRLGVLRESEAAPYGDSVALAREAAAEFENGVRVGIQLQQLTAEVPAPETGGEADAAEGQAIAADSPMAGDES